MNRGSRGTGATNRFAALRFNEAPIHESGKSDTQAMSCLWLSLLQ